VAVHEPSTLSARTCGTGKYDDWIHELDYPVGQVLKALDDRKLAGDTPVVFTSDNGGVFLTEGDRSEGRSLPRRPARQRRL
jgi:arylsulfatase A-like enzyme